MQSDASHTATDRGGVRRGHAREQLVGRSVELGQIDQMLAPCVSSGDALLIVGAPGVGKTALLDAAGETAASRGWRVERATGFQGGAQSAFEGLHAAVHPLLSALPVLPTRQRAALEIVFGLAEGAPPEMLLVQIGALSLLEEAAATQPLVLLVDDTQWLDEESASVLAFVAQRVSTAPIALIVATRVNEDSRFDHVTRRLVLESLGTADSLALLNRSGFVADSACADRIIAQAEGNPLALIELSNSPGGMTSMMSGHLPLPMRLRRVFGDQVRALSTDCQFLLLMAASNDRPSLHELAAAASAAGVDIATLEEAEKAAIVSVTDNDIQFRHPLVRSAVYESANAADRIRAHTALAAALLMDPDRAVLHRASATLLPNREVADELEHSAHRQAARGGVASAARTYERAARLSADPGDFARRLGSSASTAMQAGDLNAAVRLCQEAVANTADPALLGELAWVQYGLAVTTDQCRRSVASLIAIANAAPESGRARVLACAGLQSFLFHGESASARHAVEEAMLNLNLDPNYYLRVQTLCLTNPTKHAAEFAPLIRELAQRPEGLRTLMFDQRWDIEPGAGAPCVMGLGTTADALNLPRESYLLYSAGTRHAADTGDLPHLCIGLKNSANRMITAGALDEAMGSASQAERMSADAGLTLTAAGAAAVKARAFAWRGDRAGVAECIDHVRRTEAARNRADTVALRWWAEGLLALGEARFADAYDALEGMTVFEPLAMEAIADFAEAALHLPERHEQANLRVAGAAAYATATGSMLLAEVVNRAQALLAIEDDHAARCHFEDALSHPDPQGWDSERARTQLAFGEWLLGRENGALARPLLQAAERTLAAMDAAPWHNRARGALAKSGGTATHYIDSVSRRLSAQEWQIARLVSTGKSNREIADLLFLSHRTVGAHLYRIFPKLDVRTRTELAALVLADELRNESTRGA